MTIKINEETTSGVQSVETEQASLVSLRDVDFEARDRAGRFMLARGLSMGDKVDAGAVQDMLVEYNAYLPFKTSECKPFIQAGMKIKTAGHEAVVTDVGDWYFIVDYDRTSALFDFKNPRAEIGIPFDVVMEEFKARGVLVNTHRAMRESAEREVEELQSRAKDLQRELNGALDVIEAVVNLHKILSPVTQSTPPPVKALLRAYEKWERRAPRAGSGDPDETLPQSGEL